MKAAEVKPHVTGLTWVRSTHVRENERRYNLAGEARKIFIVPVVRLS
jgi:hypothetical protein